MKTAENQEFLIVDTENENKPFSRVYVFRKDCNDVKTYDIKSLSFNLYSPFDDWEKRASVLCEELGII